MEETMALVSAGTERERLVAVFSFACPEEGAESNRAVFADFLRTVHVDPAPVPASTGMRPIAQDVEMDVALPPMPGVRGR
jgi:hypothetical protein